MTSVDDWWNYAASVVILLIIVRLVFWLPLKAKRIERDKAYKHMRETWRRTWDRLGRLEARDRARKLPPGFKANLSALLRTPPPPKHEKPAKAKSRKAAKKR